MIDYVTAWNGQLYFHAQDKNETRWWYVKTVEEGVELFINETYSSAMDYGDEMLDASNSGFPYDRAAFDMLMEIIDQAEPLCEEIG
tara:strand:+ start:4333 stop:4590 length:258 start_codon:yes stop_codon:yes gene_type:complete